MYIKQPKKMLVINMLDVLRKYSDADHRLSQKEIIHILERDYGMIVDRKAVKRNLINLLEFGYEIEYTEKTRVNKNGEPESILTDWYLVRELSDAELRLIIDSLLFSKHIPNTQRRELVNKIEELSSKYFKSKMRHVHSLTDDGFKNPELFYTIEILDEAIEKWKQVEFTYLEYGTDKKPHQRLDSKGEVRKYLVNPYQMVTANGRYYLICNYDKYDDISHYRIDKIKNIQLLDTPAKKVGGVESGFNLPKHMAEHIYMFSGESKHITMRTAVGMADILIEWFGNSVTFKDEKDGIVTVSVVANERAMRFWALQYAPYVTIISPQSLVDEIKSDLATALVKYDAIEKNKNLEVVL